MGSKFFLISTPGRRIVKIGHAGDVFAIGGKDLTGANRKQIGKSGPGRTKTADPADESR
jgi:hypothetical protein